MIEPTLKTSNEDLNTRFWHNEFGDVFQVRQPNGDCVWLSLTQVREFAAFAEDAANRYGESLKVPAFDGAVALAKIGEALADCEPRNKFMRACITLRKYAKTTRDADKYDLLACKRFCEALLDHNML